MPKTIKQLREERSAAAKAARNILDQNEGVLPKDKSEDLDKLYTSIEGIDAQIEREQRQLDVEALSQSQADDPDTPATPGQPEPRARPGDEVRAQVFEAYLRGGERGVERLPENVLVEYGRQVQNAQSTGTDSEGGYLVPTTFSGQLLEAMAAFGGVRSVADVQSMASGETIQWPTVDETAEEGEWLAENTAADDDGDITFGTTSIGAHLASSRVVAVPLALLQDAGIGDLEAMIKRLLATRLSRTTNKAYTVGDGTGKPSGVVAGAALGHTTASGLVASFTWDDFTELEHSVDPAYRAQARFMFHDTVLKLAKKLKDLDGRPIWVPGVSGSAPAEINGYQYTINQNMAVPAASAKSVLFGDFKKYLIRDVMDVTLMRFSDSAYAKKGQVGFLAMLRTDGKVIAADNKAIKHMAQAAS